MTYDIELKVVNSESESVVVPEERPELLAGATFVRLGHDHLLAAGLLSVTNPLTGQPMRVIVDESLGGAHVRLGVAAHDARSSALAREYDLPFTPVVAQDFGKPLPDCKDVFGVVVIGYDPKTSKYLGLKHGEQTRLVSGGREPRESYDECAQRELSEEAGYSDVTTWISLGDPVYSFYYNSVKDSNRRSLGYNYLAILDSSAESKPQQEAHEDFQVWWTDFDKLYDGTVKTGGGVDHWLDALKRAKSAAESHHAGKPFILPPYTGEGMMINAGKYDGLDSEAARKQIIHDLHLKPTA